MIMKRLLLMAFLLTCVMMPARALVRFTFEPGSVSGVRSDVQSAMESNVSALLTEIDNAYNGKRSLNLSGLNIESIARNRLNAVWDSAVHFYPRMKDVSVKLVRDFQGYQARQILVRLEPDPTYHGSLTRELNVSFNRKGVITGVRLVDSDEISPEAFFEDGIAVDDLERRMEVVKWVEDFRSYYLEGNAQAIEDIFSENAIIITGSVHSVKTKMGDGSFQIRKEVKYNSQNRTQYANKLRQIFKKGKVKLKFDRISVRASGTYPDCYGVTLHQTWKGPNGYEDVGWVFLLWDFSVPDQPQIHVRTWQPDEIIHNEGDVLGLPDFFIPTTPNR